MISNRMLRTFLSIEFLINPISRFLMNSHIYMQIPKKTRISVAVVNSQIRLFDLVVVAVVRDSFVFAYLLVFLAINSYILGEMNRLSNYSRSLESTLSGIKAIDSR